MSRRRKGESWFDLLALLPWWVTLALGLIIMSSRNPKPTPSNVAGGSSIVWYLIFSLAPWLCFAASALSGIKALKRSALFSSANDIGTIRAMSWREFEALVGEAYRRKGYMVEETGGCGADGGIDLILRGRGRKIVVQCKQWRTFKVGVKVVREMYGIMTAEQADHVVIVASGTYTQEAIEFARGKPIELMDGRALVQLIRDVKGKSGAAPADSSVQPTHVSLQKLNVQMAASGATAPSCPRCGLTMVLRTARNGPNAGGQFWGCPSYPNCRGILNIN
jgi:restriction system protein